MAVELFCVILSTCTATTTVYHYNYYNYYSNCFVQLYYFMKDGTQIHHKLSQSSSI